MTHQSIISALGGPRLLAEELGLPERRVRGWRDRDSIPARYWLDVVRVAGCRDVSVTYETLIQAARAAA